VHKRTARPRGPRTDWHASHIEAEPLMVAVSPTLSVPAYMPREQRKSWERWDREQHPEREQLADADAA